MRPFYKDYELSEEGSVISRCYNYDNRIGPKLNKTGRNAKFFTFTIEKPYPLFEQLNVYYDAHVRKNLKFQTNLNYTGRYITPSEPSNLQEQYFFNMGDYLVEIRYQTDTYILQSDTMENLFAFTYKVKNFQSVKEANLIQI